LRVEANKKNKLFLASQQFTYEKYVLANETAVVHFYMMLHFLVCTRDKQNLDRFCLFDIPNPSKVNQSSKMLLDDSISTYHS